MLYYSNLKNAKQETSNAGKKNKGLFVNLRIKILISSIFVFNSVSKGVENPVKTKKTASLQIFGDLYIPQRVIKETNTNQYSPAVFSKIKRLMASSKQNVANFEGVATLTNMPLELKKFLLKMPIWIGQALKAAGIDTVSLANNHALDFGESGLFSSQVSLNRAGIETFGAGINKKEAARPVFLPVGRKIGCLLSFSRTLPASFWAKDKKAGTSFLSYKETETEIKRCSALGYFTVAIFHWGAEMTNTPKTYQIELARLSIDAGADLVVGHHPHILQTIEVYKGKPIFYSIGNFAFGSYTIKSPQEGMSVRVSLPRKKPVIYDLVPINVQNNQVKFFPKLFQKDEENPLDPLIPNRFCKKNYSTNFGGTYYSCVFEKNLAKR